MNFLKVTCSIATIRGIAFPQSVNLLGIAVSATGRKFINFARSLDPNNIAYTVGGLIGNHTDTPYRSTQISSQPGGAIDYPTTLVTGANYEKYLISGQSFVIYPLDRLTIHENDRAAMQNGTIVPYSVGGPNLIGVNLTHKTIFKTIVVPPNAVC